MSGEASAMDERTSPDGSGILRELLQSHKFKASVNLAINRLDPDEAAELVRAFMWEDVAFFMGLLGATPRLINTMISTLNELLTQLSSIPLALLVEFLSNVIGDTDLSSLGEATGRIAGLALNIERADTTSLVRTSRAGVEEFSGGLVRGLRESTKGEAGMADMVLTLLVPFLEKRASNFTREARTEGSEADRMIEGLAGALRDFLRDNPGFREAVVSPLADAWSEGMESG